MKLTSLSLNEQVDLHVMSWREMETSSERPQDGNAAMDVRSYFPSLTYLLSRCSQIICVDADEEDVEKLLMLFKPNKIYYSLFEEAIANEMEQKKLYESGWWTQKTTQFSSKQKAGINIFELTYEVAWIMFNKAAESRKVFVKNIVDNSLNCGLHKPTFTEGDLHYPSAQTEDLFLYIKTLVNIVPDPPSLKYLEALQKGTIPIPISHLLSVEPERTIEANLLRLLQIRCSIALIGSFANTKLISSCNGLAFYLAFNGQIKSHPYSVAKPQESLEKQQNIDHLHKFWRSVIHEMVSIAHLTDPTTLISEKENEGYNKEIIVHNESIILSYLKGINASIKKLKETPGLNTDNITMTQEFLDTIERIVSEKTDEDMVVVHGMKVYLPLM